MTFSTPSLAFFALSALTLVDASNGTDHEEIGKRDCVEKSVSDACICEHRSWLKNLCSKCKDKFKWGHGCDLECSKERCPYGCDLSGNCNVPSTCIRNDRAQDPTEKHEVTNEHGECQACEGDHHGLWSTKKCPKNCGSSPEGVCSRGGKCYACKKGYYGRQCDQECPKNCPDCVFDDNLIQSPDGETFLPAGTCPDQCKVDFHGSRCDQPCPANCKKTAGWFNRKRIPSCKKEDGNCFECHDSKWYGEKCENACPTGCEDDQCNKADGLCKGGCKNGFFGAKCDQQCSSGCKGGGCDKENAKCDDGCKAGWRGDKCDVACPEGTGPEGCDRETGQPESCVSGSYPFKSFLNDAWICKSCPDNCNNNKCDVNGECTEGCEIGFHGKKCTANCGSNCIGACDETHTKLKDGYCTECDAGWTGNKCTKKCHATCKACHQTARNWLGLARAGDQDDDCTDCASDEPVVWDDGHCKCIEDATRDPNDKKCHCNEPTGAAAADREARFETRPRKVCRIVCKDGLREVFGNKESTCVTNEAFRAVLVAEGLAKGRCTDGFKEITVKEKGESGSECIRDDFIHG